MNNVPSFYCRLHSGPAWTLFFIKLEEYIGEAHEDGDFLSAGLLHLLLKGKYLPLHGI